MSTYKKLLNNRELRLSILNKCVFIPDKLMLKMQFRMTMGHKLNLKSPKTFNEKLQWLKLYNRNPIYTQLVDKYAVREFVKEKIGEEYLIPILGKWEKYEDIDFEKLPQRFVLKCNHDSGSIKIIMDKSKIDHDNFKVFFNKRLKNNPYRYGREWPYKNVKPCIIAETYMGDDKGVLPVDYKFFCFSGDVDSVMICKGRESSEKRFYFFNKDWKLQKYNRSSQNLDDNFTIEKPDRIDELFELASKLSKNEPFVRIDFYIIDNCIYFGEFTFFPASGFDNNIVHWADKHLGQMIKT